MGGNYTFDCGLKVIAFGQYFENQFINVNARGGVAAAGINKFTTEGIGDTATTADYRGLRLR